MDLALAIDTIMKTITDPKQSLAAIKALVDAANGNGGTAPAVDPAKEYATRARVAASQSENIARDKLLSEQGHRIEPRLRVWASTQPLAVVRAIVAAAPVKAAGRAPQGLQGRDLEDLKIGMGTQKASADRSFHRNAAGDFVLPTMTPTEFRKLQAEGKI